LNYDNYNKIAAEATTVNPNQNNYIQINGNVITQKTLKKLSPEELKEVETIFLSIFPIPVNVVISKNVSKIEL